jgi:hypothetical protein
MTGDVGQPSNQVWTSTREPIPVRQSAAAAKKFCAGCDPGCLHAIAQKAISHGLADIMQRQPKRPLATDFALPPYRFAAFAVMCH